jgi:hypothetical protein
MILSAFGSVLRIYVVRAFLFAQLILLIDGFIAFNVFSVMVFVTFCLIIILPVCLYHYMVVDLNKIQLFCKKNLTKKISYILLN